MLRKFAGTMFTLCAVAHSQPVWPADFSANIGWTSKYVYRGIPQHDHSTSAGLDFEAGGFYLGTWAADVGDGAEIDYYGGYGWEAGEVSLRVGGTLYTYTGDFDDEYLELNLGLGWKWLSLDFASGEYDNFGGPVQDYRFYSLTVSSGGFYGTYGSFGNDFDGSYLEAGYGGTLSLGDRTLFDYGVSLIHGDATLLGGRSDTNVVFSLSKGFSF